MMINADTMAIQTTMIAMPSQTRGRPGRRLGSELNTPVRMLDRVTATNTVIVTTHTTMQYGHSAPITYRL